jgi:hypothetical protein
MTGRISRLSTTTTGREPRARDIGYPPNRLSTWQLQQAMGYESEFCASSSNSRSSPFVRVPLASDWRYRPARTGGQPTTEHARRRAQSSLGTDGSAWSPERVQRLRLTKGRHIDYTWFMTTLMITTPQGEDVKYVRQLVPKKLDGWHVTTLAPDELFKVVDAPDVLLISLSHQTTPQALTTILKPVARIQGQDPSRSAVFFQIKAWPTQKGACKDPKWNYSAMVKRLQNHSADFPNPLLVDLTIAEGPALVSWLDFKRSYLHQAQHSRVGSAEGSPRPSPLDRVREIVDATSDLRNHKGRLSAKAIALAFGISTSELAEWLGRTRQGLSKTPDAPSLQSSLGFFERVARLRAVVSQGDFLKWLRRPNPELDNKEPLGMLASGDRQTVADFVDDMLTGAPT